MVDSVPMQTLPVVTAQSTFSTVVHEVYSGSVPFEDVWLSCYDYSPSRSGEPATRSSHAKVKVLLDEVDREKVIFETKEGEGQDLTVVELDIGAEHERVAASTSKLTNTYLVTLPSLSIPPTRIFTPTQEYADPERSNARRPHRITTFAVSEDKSQLTTGFLDGSVYLYVIHPLPTSIQTKAKYNTHVSYEPPRSTYTTHRQALVSSLAPTPSPKAHKSTVTSLRFFPSSRVILSSSADFSLQIYPADLLSPSLNPNIPVNKQTPRIPSVRTLLGHLRSVTATAILGRGRTIMSSSADGSLRTWDVGKGEQVPESVVRAAVGINKMIFVQDMVAAEESDEANDAETTRTTGVSVKGKLYCALQDGPKSMFRSTRSPFGALTAIAVSSRSTGNQYLATASSAGVIVAYRLPSLSEMKQGDILDTPLSTPVLRFRRTEAGIEDLAFAHW
ncbi:hypothetical protein K435DRAFT_967274 [Dendrothele bispora CBS 962.96]|uniref:Uncharacterized protein n=1 Tax=Dendrothele bispora (strain CBS 962.96) TaxID=1314807 RepID=A0A4S8LWE1_DENBC|nr:hypothetical protein K435DRAFT_967274 [Dendrothele bispora CBS 962.96]